MAGHLLGDACIITRFFDYLLQTVFMKMVPPHDDHFK